MAALEIAQHVITIAQIIYQQAKQVESNKEYCNSLEEIILQVDQSLQGLSVLPDNNNFILSLTKMQDVLTEVHKFLQKMITMPYYRRFICAGRHQKELEDFRQSIVDLIPFLDLGINAQLLINQERDRVARLEDQNAFLKQQEKDLRERRQLQSLQNRDIERMMQRQMDAFKEQMELNWRNTAPETPQPASQKSPLGEKYMVKIYDVSFEDLLISSRTGDIYRGKWQSRPVLIKFVSSSITETERQQFIREAVIMSELQDEHLVQFYGACFDKDRMCIVTGVVQHTLQECLSRLSLRQRYAMAKDLALGLQYLHSRSVIHNDIGLEHIGVTETNVAKWLDLSWVKTNVSSIASLGIAHHASVWRAPETRYASRNELQPSSDMYGFGWLLWSLYTGQVPPADTQPKQSGPKEVPQELITLSCPSNYARIIRACWEPNPGDRPSWPDILSVLEQPLPTGEDFFERGKAAEKAGDLETAYDDYLQAADQEYPKSYNSLGTFKLGKGGRTPDPREAERLFRKGAERGHAPAMFNLGRMYEKGDTATKTVDLSEALEWYRKASHADAKEPAYQTKVTKTLETLREKDSGIRKNRMLVKWIRGKNFNSLRIAFNTQRFHSFKAFNSFNNIINNINNSFKSNSIHSIDSRNICNSIHSINNSNSINGVIGKGYAGSQYQRVSCYSSSSMLLSSIDSSKPLLSAGELSSQYEEIANTLVTSLSNPCSLLEDYIQSSLSSSSSSSSSLSSIAPDHIMTSKALLAHCLLSSYPSTSSMTKYHQVMKEFEALASSTLFLDNSNLSSSSGLSLSNTLFASAILARYQGQHRYAGQLLESLLSIEPNNPILLRLTHESYLQAGDAFCAIGCIARSPQTFSDTEYLMTNIQAMLATGFCEAGRYEESIEISTRAIARSNGLDIWASRALLTCYILVGNSTETVNFVEKSNMLDLHSGINAHWIMYLKGMALTQRGNNRGALNVLGELLTSITNLCTPGAKDNKKGLGSGKDNSASDQSFVPKMLPEHVPSLCLGALLLWQVSIHIMHDQVRETWETLFDLFAQLPPLEDGPAIDPIYAICRTMVIAANTYPEFTKERQSRQELSLPKTTSAWSYLTEKFAKKKDSSVATPKPDSRRRIPDGDQTLINEHFKQLREHKVTPNTAYPKLGAVKPITELNRVHGFDLAYSDILSNTIGICDGIHAFTSGNFEAAADSINRMYPWQRQLGLSSLHRYLLDQTLTESYLRSGRYVEAQQLLAERTCLASNDGQAWIRLGDVFQNLNDPINAHRARYNAWQLGIGQGGFGGPR